MTPGTDSRMPSQPALSTREALGTPRTQVLAVPWKHSGQVILKRATFHCLVLYNFVCSQKVSPLNLFHPYLHFQLLDCLLSGFIPSTTVLAVKQRKNGEGLREEQLQ